MRKPSLTVRQKKLIAQIPAIASGKKSQTKALKDAGYSDQTAHQQQRALGSVRIQSAMQEALLKAGVDHELIGMKIREGLNAKNGSGKADHHARHKFIVTAAELHDAFPSKKLEHQITNSVSYADLEAKAPAVAKTPEEAKKLAEAILTDTQ